MDNKKITALCEQKGISIKDLAEKINFSFSGLYSALKNNSLKIETLEKIADVLEVHITYFFDTEKKQEQFEYNIKKLAAITDRYHTLDSIGMRNFVIFIASFCKSNQQNYKLLRDAYKKYVEDEYQMWQSLFKNDSLLNEKPDKKDFSDDLRETINTLVNDSQLLEELLMRNVHLLGDEFMIKRKKFKREIGVL